ncbi:hypothetical protein ONZ51_g3961 [Trametes cubensis]|uniref:DUF6533 domain-containing protein n=1 Tax=Trametes cubensis TaxID=1111947 RepID=A0AAD7TX99_9APHY|nr:hypothetical protein ONZ51_g3961 [Trametes cubensis]
MPGLDVLLEHALYHLDLLAWVKYTSVAALTCVVLDVAETLGEEVALVWPSHMSAMKMIFFLNRYMPFVDISLAVYLFLGVRSPKICSVLWPIVVALYPLGSIISEVILMVRTLAIWNFHKAVWGLMIAVGIGIVIPFVSVIQQYFRNLHYPSRSVLEYTGCVASISDSVGWVFYASIIVSETTVVALTLLKLYTMKGSRSTLPRLFRTMYRDGTCFYCALLCISVANLLCMRLAPVGPYLLMSRIAVNSDVYPSQVEMSSALQLPHRAIHSTLCSRVLLNLRAAAAGSSGLTLDEFNRTSHIAFDVPSAESDNSGMTLLDLELQPI